MTVGPLLDDNDVLVCNDNEMGEMLKLILFCFCFYPGMPR